MGPRRGQALLPNPPTGIVQEDEALSHPLSFQPMGLDESNVCA